MLKQRIQIACQFFDDFSARNTGEGKRFFHRSRCAHAASQQFADRRRVTAEQLVEHRQYRTIANHIRERQHPQKLRSRRRQSPLRFAQPVALRKQLPDACSERGIETLHALIEIGKIKFVEHRCHADDRRAFRMQIKQSTFFTRLSIQCLDRSRKRNCQFARNKKRFRSCCIDEWIIQARRCRRGCLRKTIESIVFFFKIAQRAQATQRDVQETGIGVQFPRQRLAIAIPVCIQIVEHTDAAA
ncbi:MAG: hypothetical protein ABL934_01720 [Lysobacteraceae bacterium]